MDRIKKLLKVEAGNHLILDLVFVMVCAFQYRLVIEKNWV